MQTNLKLKDCYITALSALALWERIFLVVIHPNFHLGNSENMTFPLVPVLCFRLFSMIFLSEPVNFLVLSMTADKFSPALYLQRNEREMDSCKVPTQALCL